MIEKDALRGIEINLGGEGGNFEWRSAAKDYLFNKLASPFPAKSI